VFTSRRIATISGDVFRDEYSLEFDGTNDYIAVSNDSSIQFDDDALTISLWIKPSDVNSDWDYIIGKGDLSSGTQSYALYQKNTNGILRFELEGASGSRAETTTALINERWYHIACTYDKIKTKIYIDGDLEAEASYSTAVGTNTENLHIGIGQTTGNAWNGKISDLAMYNSTLTASQVKTIYNGREPYNHKEGIAVSNLVGWWRMGDGVENHTGTTIYDMSLNSNNGTITNMALDDFTGDTP
jgi:hypothetical protein